MGGLDMFLLQAELAMYSPVMEDINTVGDQNRNIREFKEVVTFTNAFFLISLPEKLLRGWPRYLTTINVSKA